MRTRELRDALLAQAEVIHQGSQEGLVAEVDRADARGRYAVVLAAFGAGPDTPTGEATA